MKPALLLVDLQGDYLDTPGLQPDATILTHHTAALLDACRLRKIPAIHIWTTVQRENDRRLPHWKKSGLWQCVAGTEGHKTPAVLSPRENEIIIHKSSFNGFASGELDKILKNFGCDTVVLAGLHLHTCVRTVAAESLERRLNVFIAEDAVATNDPVFAAGTRRWLAARCVEFLSTNEVLSRLDGQAPSKLIHRSPRETEKILFEIPTTSASEIAIATTAAQIAWQNWRQTDLGSRCAFLENFAVRLEAAAPELAHQMAVEIGKPVSHGLEETRRAAANVHDVIRRAQAFAFETREPAGIVRHQPVSVVALISPFNNPVAIAVGKITPALIYGNVVVWKSAPAATKISEAILRLLRETGLPENAVQLLTGDHTPAQSLVADKNVDAVTITSSALAGHAIAEICARRFTPLQAELSGNNAAIVWDDADLPHAAAQIVWGAFGFAGQRCTANRRVIVSEKILENFLDELNNAAAKLVWGDPLESATDIGPVIHTGKRAEHDWLMARAKRVLRPFENLADKMRNKTGAYAEPAILVCDDENDLLVQEETMTPLLVVQRAENFDRALELCNGVRHGLVAALFSENAALQKKFLAETRAGMLKLNSATAGVDVSLPFGGWKESGLGPAEHGEADRLFYTRMQAIYPDNKAKQKP